MKILLIILICFALCGCVPAVAGSEGFATYYTAESCQREGTSGTLTASGQQYNESQMTCALPFHPPKVNGRRQWGKEYRITNLETGKSITVRHLDYGPGKKARARGVVVDLTPSAFKALGAELKQGRIKVKVEDAPPSGQ
ncbi:MAG: septal ring lytic transglycosylase RlpA family protein [Eubacteriales bacterium]|jgi:rare lipoprotein A (peptidoglycan hydrolase)